MPFRNVTVDRSLDKSAYEQVRDKILELIERGVLTDGHQLPPEPELAKAFGVSRMTANRALGDLCQAGVVTRHKGRGTFVTGNMPHKSAGKITVFLSVDVEPAYDDFYFGPLFWSIDRYCHEKDLVNHIARWDRQADIRTSYKDANGFIVISPEEPMIDDLLRIRSFGIPVVILGASWPGHGISSVDSDNRLGAALATNHLLDLGHERILFVGGNANTSNTQDRVRGFQFTLKSRGLAHNAEKDMILAARASLTDKEADAIVQRLQGENGYTGVFAAGPHLATGIYRAAKRAGLSIPQDFSLVAYDDPAVLPYLDPPVTTVRQPLQKMATNAVDLLDNLIASQDPREHNKILDPELIIRNSTAKL